MKAVSCSKKLESASANGAAVSTDSADAIVSATFSPSNVMWLPQIKKPAYEMQTSS
jgi:hypothetical protein